MNVYLRTGTSRTFRLKHAILLYEDEAAKFATLHGIRTGTDVAPQLSAGRTVTTAFLHTLAKGLKRDLRPEILPENVLIRTAEAIAWWTRAWQRAMFFRGSDPGAEVLNGKIYPHPALVFLISGKDLYVRALSDDIRPSADTRVKNAPYWNTDAQGLVCQVVIGCVDSAAARGAIRDWTSGYSRVHYWLDLGNKSDREQFVLGEPPERQESAKHSALKNGCGTFPGSRGCAIA